MDEDALFGSLDLGSIEGASSEPTPIDYDALLGDTSVRDRYAATDSDAWNFLLIRLADGRDASREAAALSLDLGAPESGLIVSDWRWGAGVQAELAFHLQMAFNIVVFIVVVVAVIIIMNTLVISITERIPEIGTMRAIGAGRNFVRGMIVAETLMVSLAFGLLGMAAGSLVIWLLGQAGLSSSNQMLQALFGGSVFRPSVSFAALRNSLAVVLAVGFVILSVSCFHRAQDLARPGDAARVRSAIMNQSLRIAFRNVGRQKKRTFLLAGAVGIGFFIITLVGGLTGGIAESARVNFSNAFGGHLYFSGTVVSERGSEIAVMADPKPLETVLDGYRDEIASVRKRSGASGTLIFGTRELRQSISGVDFAEEADFAQGLRLLSGSLERLGEPGSLILPAETAKKLGVETGEALFFRNSTVYGQQNVTELILVATFEGQSSFGVDAGYANLAEVNALLGLGAQEFQTLNVWLYDDRTLDSTAGRILADLSRVAPVETRDEEGGSPMRQMAARFLGASGPRAVADGGGWEGTRYGLITLNDLMSQFNSLLTVIDALGFWIFVVLLGITMVGVMNSYRMVMVERTAEIGTMRALGLQRSGVRDIFLWEAMFVSLAGALAGLISALAVMGLASFAVFPGGTMLSFFLDSGRLRFSLGLGVIARNLALLAGFSLLAVSFPARAASRLKPAEALRAAY